MLDTAIGIFLMLSNIFIGMMAILIGCEFALKAIRFAMLDDDRNEPTMMTMRFDSEMQRKLGEFLRAESDARYSVRRLDEIQRIND